MLNLVAGLCFMVLGIIYLFYLLKHPTSEEEEGEGEKEKGEDPLYTLNYYEMAFVFIILGIIMVVVTIKSA
jgi:Ca2+/Na+ antiporter